MTIENASIPIGATFAPTGGSATTVAKKRTTEKSVQTYLDDGSELLDQTIVEFSTTSPAVQTSAPNGYTQARNEIHIKSPLSLDNGKRTMNTVLVRFAVDHETTAAEKLSLRSLVTNLLNDSEFTDFFDNQSLA